MDTASQPGASFPVSGATASSRDAQRHVFVNGERHRLLSESTLLSLLGAFDVAVETKGVAVAVNGEIAPRHTWAERRLHDGDRIEIVRAAPGG